MLIDLIYLSHSCFLNVKKILLNSLMSVFNVQKNKMCWEDPTPCRSKETLNSAAVARQRSQQSEITEAFFFWLILWCRKYNNNNTKEKSGWHCVSVALTGGGLLTTTRMTVRSRHRSKWRATCLSATCWSSSACTSRQSVESHLSSHWPEGGSRAHISTLNCI